jgi:capsular exopolysaccharide synthesis family protein
LTPNDFLRLIRKRWLLIAVCTLIGVGVSAASIWRATPQYQASAQLFVAAKDSGDLSTLAQGGQFTQQRVQSYAEIVDSPQVTGPVAAQLGGGLSALQIAHEVSASAPLNTVLVNVHVTDPSAARAQALANAVSEQFATYAAQLETTPGGAASPVKVTVVKHALLPTSPVSPKKALDLILGLLVGLAIGIGAAVLRESLDTSVKTGDDIQEIGGRGTIGVIGFDSDAKKHPLVVAHGAHPSRSEAFRQLRTNLQFVDVDAPPRSIVFTSSVPGEGKTTTVCNLSITLAQAGTSVLLIEADLRRPRASNYLGLTDSVGLTNVLAGSVRLGDVTQRWGDLDLHVLPAGPTPPNPSELLGSRGMADLLAQAEVDYDLVLLDAPPLLPVTDAAVLAAQASGAVVIVRHGKTHGEQLRRSVEALESVNAKLLGCILNMTPTRGPDAYHYGYSYQTSDRPRHRSTPNVSAPEASSTWSMITVLSDPSATSGNSPSSNGPSDHSPGAADSPNGSQPRRVPVTVLSDPPPGIQGTDIPSDLS